MTQVSTVAAATPQRRPLLARASLRFRILLLVTLSLVIAVAVSVVAVSYNARNAVLAQAERDVEVLARVIARTVAAREPADLAPILGGLVESGALDAIYVVDRKLTPLAQRVRVGASKQGASAADRDLLARAIELDTEKTRIAGGEIEVYAPIRDPARGVVGAFLVRLPRDELDRLLAKELQTSLLIGLLVVALGGFASFAFADRIVRPIGRITAAAARVQKGHFGIDSLDAVAQRDDEVGRLASVFRSMAREVESRERVLDELVEQRTRELGEKNAALEAARKETADELAIARALQISILPSSFPATPGCAGAARMIPALEMGGDFYDFIELPGGFIGVVIADVSGKGVPAAFFMAVARTNLRSLASRARGPGECLRRANDVLCAQNPLDLFVTVFYGIFDPETGQLAYANGGHNPPYVMRADGRIEPLPSPAGIALGMLPDVDFAERVEQLAPGDRVLLFTDGVTEAFDAANRAYGDERLVRTLRDSGAAGPQALVDAVCASVTRFAGAAAQSDDITVAALAWDPKTSV